LVLTRSGIVPDLQEETAEVWTAGLDIAQLAGLSLSLTYFDIAYQDKIQVGVNPPASALTLESLYAGTGIIIRNPTPAQIAELCNQPGVTVNCGQTFGAIVDLRLRNVAVVDVSGVDLTAGYSFGTRLGTLNVGVGGTYTFNYEEAVTKVAQPVDFIDTMGRPLALRLRGTVGWAFKGWNANAAVSYADDYEFSPTISTKVDSWTTVDLSAGYDFESSSGWMTGLRAQLAATNVFDKQPPFIDQYVGYDSANGSLMGRTVSIQVVKQW
jgi:iron complex outermembrane receptor protein